MRIIILALYMALFIVACGGSSTPSTTKEPADQTKIGVFIDAPVKGLAYTSLPSGKKGITNEKGEFEYIDGDIVSFNMGSIELGTATPDKTKTVKVTQLKEAILVAQLLQVLDSDADEDKIDVSDIVIPEAIQEVIVEKLKRTENPTEDNIISKEQFEEIKQKNPKKLTLQQRPEIISKNKVLEHVKQQIGGADLRFSASELKSHYLIEASLLNNFDGIAIGFSDENSPAIQIDVKNNLVAKTSAEMSRSEWEIDSKGRLSLSSNGFACKIKKIGEDSDAMDVGYYCDGENNGLGLARLVKPQPFSANDLSGKSFNFKSNNRTITFGNDGSVNCNGEKSSCTYENHPIHKNAVWIKGGGDKGKGEDNTLMLLAQGSLAKGKLLMVHFDAQYNLDSIDVIKVSGNSLHPEFESVDNSDYKDNSESDKQKNEIEEAKEEAKEIKDPKEDDNEDTDNHSDSGTQNPNYDTNPDSKNSPETDKPKPNYIPFTLAMVSGNTFYSVGNEDDDKGITIFFDANKKGQVWFSLSDSNTSPDVTFDYLIDNEGYIIFSNTKEKGVVSDDTPAIGLLSETNNALTTCWGSSSVSDISDYCKDDDINIWYKTKEDAETALKQREDNDTDENTDDNSNSNDNPNAGKQKPTYVPFTQEILSSKTFYDVGKDENLTLFFGDDNKGHLWSGLTDSTTSPDLEFDYRVDSEGFIVLSNVFSRNSHSDDTPIIGLLGKGVRGHSLVTCWGKSASEITDFCEEDDKHIWYFTMEAAIAEVRAHGSVEDDPKPIPVTYIPFTRGMLSGQTLYGVGNDLDVTINFDADNTGHATTHIAVGTHIPVGTDYDHITFDYLIDSHGLLILQNRKINGRDQTNTILGLIESSDGPKVCWGDESMYKNKTSGFCIDEDIVALYRTKQLALNAQLKRDVPPKENNQENTDNHSDSGKQKPTYVPFTQEIISEKTLYNVHTDGDDENDSRTGTLKAATFIFDSSGRGKAMHGLHDSISNAEATFDYSIDAKGYLVLSNWAFTNPEEAPDDDSESKDVIALIADSEASLKICWRNNLEALDKACSDESFFKNKEAAEAFLALNALPKNPYIPFTPVMISGKTLYNVFIDREDEDEDGSNTDHLAITISVDKSNNGIGAFGLHDKITTPETNFNSSINDKGFWVLSYPDGETDVYGLIKENDYLLMACRVSSQLNGLCDENRYEYFYKDKEDTKLLLEALDREDYDRQNPTYMPFTQDMISDKTLYNVYNDWRDEDWKARTLIFDESKRGMGKPGIHKAITNPPSTFSYSINDEGFVSLSYDPEGWSEFGLIKVEDDYFKVCNVSRQSNNLCDESSYEYFYRTKEAAEAALKAYESENPDNNSDSNNSSDPGTQNPTYIAFTQEMLSDKTFYSVSNEDDDEGITIFFGANKKGQVWFSLSDSNTSPDVTFDYLIDNEGYIIFSNTKDKGVVSDDTPAIGLLSETNNALTTCWGSSSVSDISDYCKDDDINIWHKTKEDAETALKQREDNDTDENTDDNSDAENSPETYIPFTQEMISGKTFYGPDANEPITFYYGANNKGQGYFGLSSDSDYVMENPDVTFDYHIDSDGFLIFSNVSINDNSSTMGLIESSDKVIKVCWDTRSSYDMNDYCLPSDLKTLYTNFLEATDAQKELENKGNEIEEAKEEAKEIKDPKEDDNEGTDNHSDSDTQKSTYIPFTQDMISDKTIFSSNSEGKRTYQFDPSGTGKLQYNGYHETITSPNLTFDWDISEQGNLIFSNVFYGGASISTHQIYSLSKKDTSSLEVCLFASNGSPGDERNCTEEVWFYNKEEAEGASKE